MKAIRKEVLKAPEVIEINNDLESLQEAVGGYIETVTFKDFIVICDEEGRLKDKKPNCVISNKYTVPFWGTIIAVGDDGDDFKDIEISLEEFERSMAWI